MFCHVWLTKRSFEIKYTPLAEVAELADALRSGRSGGSPVRVQIPPSAHEDPLKGGFFVSGIINYSKAGLSFK